MTGPEVTAAMKAEDVDPALVEEAARAMWSIPPQDPDSALAWPSWDVAVGRADAGLWDLPQMVADTRNLARHTLAAVLPEIEAQARNAPRSSLGDDLRSIARDLGPEQAFTARLLEQAADQADFMRRALIELGDAHARLAATARETTT